MNRTVGMVVAILAIAPLTLHSAASAKQSAAQVCPSGYSLVERVCVSDTTGDIVLPTPKL